MTRTTKLTITCSIVALPLIVTLPLAAFAQSDNAAYCQALTRAYRTTISKFADPAVAVPVAMAKCEAGDAADGIPVLENALRNAKVALPPRS